MTPIRPDSGCTLQKVWLATPALEEVMRGSSDRTNAANAARFATPATRLSIPASETPSGVAILRAGRRVGAVVKFWAA